jgi:hypothetical protein
VTSSEDHWGISPSENISAGQPNRTSTAPNERSGVHGGLAEEFYLEEKPGNAVTISGDRAALTRKVRVQLSDAEIRLLFGGIHGSKIHLEEAGKNVDVWTSHAWFESPAYFSLEHDELGVILTINDFFLIDQAPPMLGTRIIANLILQAARIPGFYSIQASATRFYTPEYSGPMREVNGYYFFPRLGFNADPKNADDDIDIPDEIRGKKLLDLMADADLRHWWKVNGQTIDVSFKVHSKKSIRVLMAYLAEKGIPLTRPSEE